MDQHFNFDSNTQYEQDDYEENCIEYRSNDSIKSQNTNDLNKYLNIGLSIER